MTERMKRVAAALMAACLLAVCAPVNMLTSYAANARIAFSDPSATVGGQVSVNMKVTTAGGESLSSADIMLSYDANALEFVSGTDASGDSGAIRVHGDAGTPNTSSMTFVLKFNARAAGTTKIEITSQEIYDTSSKLVTVDKQGNSTVTVSALATASKDATLKSLQVSPGSLTPEFSPDVDTYAVTVGTDVTKIIVSAECTDDNATKIIKGNEDLQMGENRVTCRVTAQDGETAKEYVIVVTKAEGGASSTEGTGGNGGTATGVKLTAMNRSITILEPDPSVQLPSGFVESSIDIDGNKVKGWTWGVDNNPQYCVVYGMNEAGEKNFYRYDMNINEHTIQRYFEDPATADISGKYDALVVEYNNLCKDYEMRLIVIIVLAVIAVILLILAIWQIVSRNKPSDPDRGPRRTSRGRKADERLEEVDEDEYGEEIPQDYPEEDYEPYEEQEAGEGLDVMDVLEEDEDPEAESIRFEPQVRRAREAAEAVNAQHAARSQTSVTREPVRTPAPAREPRVPAGNPRRTAGERRAAGAHPQAGPEAGAGQSRPVNRAEANGGRPARPESRPQRQTAEPSPESRPQRQAAEPSPESRPQRQMAEPSPARPVRRAAEGVSQPGSERPVGQSRPQAGPAARHPQAGPEVRPAERPQSRPVQTRPVQPRPAEVEEDEEIEVFDLD